MHCAASSSEKEPFHKRRKVEGIKLVRCTAGGHRPFNVAEDGASGRKMVFGAWQDCQAEVGGEYVARFKKFPALRGAMEFLVVGHTPEPQPPPKSVSDQMVYTDGVSTGQHTTDAEGRARLSCVVWGWRPPKLEHA